MVSKDQTIGGLIFIICVIVAIVYAIALIFPTYIFSWIEPPIDPTITRLWLVAVPVLIAFLVVLFIGAWIGWTMATTPPPKPLEEIEIEEKAEEEKKE